MLAVHPGAQEVDPKQKTARAKAPVFVIGCSRSGTTLLYHMILSSGNFAVYRHESHAFNLLEPRFRPLHLARRQRQLLDFWCTTDLFARTGLDRSIVEARMRDECQNGGDFLAIFMEEMCRAQGVERWADTTPEHLLYLRRIKQTIPNALIVHVIRDGRDVAASWEKLSQIRRLPWDRRRPAMAAAIYWEWFVNQGREFGRSLGNDYIEVRYEDIVQNPAAVLETLEPFLEHSLDHAEILKNAIGSVSRPNTAFQENAASPIGRWRAEFTPQETGAMESLIGSTLEQLGYPIETRTFEKQPRSSLRRLRAHYRAYFETKQFLKTRTPVGPWLVTRNLYK